MKISEDTIPIIEKALNLKLYEGQKHYILHNGPYWFNYGRTTGKTLAYCVKLALSDGEPLNIKKPWNICDYDYGRETNKINYSMWFAQYFLDIWHALKDAGLPVREVRT